MRKQWYRTLVLSRCSEHVAGRKDQLFHRYWENPRQSEPNSILKPFFYDLNRISLKTRLWLAEGCLNFWNLPSITASDNMWVLRKAIRASTKDISSECAQSQVVFLLCSVETRFDRIGARESLCVQCSSVSAHQNYCCLQKPGFGD